MKKIALALMICLLWTGIALAQVSVEVVIGQDQFLPNESIPVKVRLVNDSGQTLRFGQEKWLTYSVEGRDGLIVLKTGEVPLAHDFEIKAGKTGTARADLAPYFDISKTGRYIVTATAHVKDWNREVSSPPARFDVVSGTKIWEQSFGVPQSTAGSGEPEARKYVLQQATFVKRMNLYFRLTDASESKTFRVFSLGPMISFSNPQMRLDQKSQLHMLYQEAAQLYNYLIIDCDGKVVGHQTFYYANSAPRLKTDEAGNPIIVGGVRHFADNDVPPSRKSILTNDIPPLVP